MLKIFKNFKVEKNPFRPDFGCNGELRFLFCYLKLHFACLDIVYVYMSVSNAQYPTVPQVSLVASYWE